MPAFCRKVPGVLTLDRPEALNALATRLLSAIADQPARASADEAARAVVLTEPRPAPWRSIGSRPKRDGGFSRRTFPRFPG